MLLNQAWAVGQIFDERPASQEQLELFLRTGAVREMPDQKEPINPRAEEIVAQILADGGQLKRIDHHAG